MTIRAHLSIILRFSELSFCFNSSFHVVDNIYTKYLVKSSVASTISLNGDFSPSTFSVLELNCVFWGLFLALEVYILLPMKEWYFQLSLWFCSPFYFRRRSSFWFPVTNLSCLKFLIIFYDFFDCSFIIYISCMWGVHNIEIPFGLGNSSLL